MTSTRAGCALRAQLRGDPMLGSAVPQSRVLMIEQPGPWGRAGLRESGFDPATAGALERAATAAGVRVELIRRPGRSPAPLRRQWALADTRDDHRSLLRGTFRDDMELLDLPLDGSVGAHDERPLYLVCAHSRHDVCCARRGRPMAAALEVVRPGRVWECSHLGGDRFAPNVLVLPLGLMYGRVLPMAAEEFASAADRGQVVLELLRGQMGLAPAEQAALAFALQHLGVQSAGAVRVETTTPVIDGRVHVTLTAPRGRLTVTMGVERVPVDDLTCSNPGPNTYVAHRLVDVAGV